MSLAKVQKQILHTCQHGPLKLLESIHMLHKDVIHWSQCICEKTGDTPLHFAAQENRLDIVEYLCETWTPCNIDIVNKDGKTALHCAAQFHKTETLEYLIKQGADINKIKRGDWTPLMLACAKKTSTCDCVNILMKYNPERLMKNKDGWSCLHLTARTGDVNVFKSIWNDDINELLFPSNNGRTVLHITVLHGNLHLMQLFLYKGITQNELNLPDKCGHTTVHDAVLSGDVHIVQLLVKYGADVTKCTNAGLTALHLAATSGKIDVIEYLIKKCNFDVNITTESTKFTPLHCAYRAKQYDAISLLLMLKADETVLDNFGRLPKCYL